MVETGRDAEGVRDAGLVRGDGCVVRATGLRGEDVGRVKLLMAGTGVDTAWVWLGRRDDGRVRGVDVEAGRSGDGSRRRTLRRLDPMEMGRRGLGMECVVAPTADAARAVGVGRAGDGDD